MIEGVNGSSANYVAEMKTADRQGEPVHAKKELRYDSMPAGELPGDSVSLYSQRRKLLINLKPTKNERRQDCAFPVLRTLVARILQDQHTASRINDGELEAIVIDKISHENAKSLVASDGHWQPDQTASRIISFALTISGNDPEKLDGIKECISSGFDVACESFGGEMPEISARTLTAVLKGLDEWSKKTGDTRSK